MTTRALPLLAVSIFAACEARPAPWAEPEPLDPFRATTGAPAPARPVAEALAPPAPAASRRVRSQRWSFSFLAPSDAEVTEGELGLVLQARFHSVREIEALVVLVPRATSGPVTDAEIERMASRDLGGAGLRVVERGTRALGGRTLPTWIYDDAGAGTRAEWVAIPRPDHVLLVSFGAERTAFDRTAAARDELFASLELGEDAPSAGGFPGSP